MSAHDETMNTTTEMNNNDDDRWTNVNRRGQIVVRPRRFIGLSHREGFADYVEEAYWAARRLGLLEELAALPSLEDKSVTEITDLTRTLAERICGRMPQFRSDCGPNLYYGALTQMVKAAKEDVTPLPTLPTSPLIRQSAATESLSDSEIYLGRAALRDLKHAITTTMTEGRVRADEVNDNDMVIRSAAAATDISGVFIQSVPGYDDDTPALPLLVDEDNDRHSDEDSASVEDHDDDVTSSGEEADIEDDSHEVTGPDDDDDGDSAASESEDDETSIPVVPAPVVFQQKIEITLPLWAWLAILVAFTAWVAFVNGVLSRCRS